MTVRRVTSATAAAVCLLAGMSACGDDGDGATVNDTGNTLSDATERGTSETKSPDEVVHPDGHVGGDGAGHGAGH